MNLSIGQVLSRLDLTGPITQNMPNCVLEEIGDAHGIEYKHEEYEMFCKNIEREKIVITNDNNTNLRKIARFLNNKTRWKASKLIEAYNFYEDCVNNKVKIIENFSKFCIGRQSPENAISLNCCILYNVCKKNGMDLYKNTKELDMVNFCNMLCIDYENLMMRCMSIIQNNFNKQDLVNFLIKNKENNSSIIEEGKKEININVIPRNNDFDSFEMMKTVYEPLSNIEDLRMKILPTTKYGCISLAALNYGINLNYCENPITEFYELKAEGVSKYNPKDRWMNYWYKKNSCWFDLTKTFSPSFPELYYNKDVLSLLTKNEGFTNDDLLNSSHYELLQLSYISDTFYLGITPGVTDNRTCIYLDEEEDCEYGTLLSYGKNFDNMKLITLDELIDLFEKNKNFSSPFDSNSNFSEHAINKLKIIAQSPYGEIIGKKVSDDVKEKRNRLVSIINKIRQDQFIDSSQIQNFLSYYRNSTPDTKKLIVETFEKLLHAGMYMRGWSGPTHEYPLFNTETPKSQDTQVAFDVTETLNQYQRNCRYLGKIGEKINSLPLVHYKSGEYQKSTEPLNGLTIGERISIVQQGDLTSNLASCIRLSSNWICSSAHMYIMSLGLPPPFDIFKLRDIA